METHRAFSPLKNETLRGNWAPKTVPDYSHGLVDVTGVMPGEPRNTEIAVNKFMQITPVQMQIKEVLCQIAHTTKKQTSAVLQCKRTKIVKTDKSNQEGTQDRHHAAQTSK